MNKERITYLFYRHFNNSSSVEEKEELSALMHDPVYQDTVMDLMEEAWKSYHQSKPHFSDEKSRNLLANILSHPLEEQEPALPLLPEVRSTKPLWTKLASIAALLILGIGLGYYYLQSDSTLTPTSTGAVVASSIHKATLRLQDGSLIQLDQLALNTKVEHDQALIQKLENGHIVYTGLRSTTNNGEAIHTITTPKGGQYAVTLPDGSKVWLNTASSITYPLVFEDKKRKVSFTGEAFFEIAKNESAPFIIEANGTEVEVVGTQFNIYAYPDESLVKTTLVEGAVKVHKSNKTRLLQPGEQASTWSNNSQIHIQDADLEQVLAWKNGYFQFEQTPLKDVMKQLSDWYDVEVVYEGKAPSKTFSGEIPRSYSLPQVLEILEISQVQLNKNQKSILIKP